MKNLAHCTQWIVALLVCATAVGQNKTNNVFLANSFPGNDSATQLNACLAAASAVGGTCDARMFTGNQYMSRQINVANGAVFLIPQTASWIWDLRDGVSAGLMQYTGSSIIGTAPGGGGGQMLLLSGSSATNMLALYATDGSPNYGSYIYASGFNAQNPYQGATFSHGVVYTRLIFDESRMERVSAFNGFGDAWHILSACCDTEFIQVQASTAYGPLAGTPLTVENAVGQAYGSAFTWSGTVNYGGDGHPNIDIQDGNYSMDFPELYAEANGPSDRYTAVIQVETTNPHDPVIRLLGGGANVGGPKPCFSVPAAYPLYNFINNNWCGPNVTSNQTINTAAINGAAITGGKAASLGSVSSTWFGYTPQIIQPSWDSSLPQNGQIAAGLTTFTPTSVGWYRVFSGYMLQGGFDIRTADPEQDIVGMVRQGWYGAPASVTILNTGFSYGGPRIVTQVATSSNNSVFGEYLDLYVADVSNPTPISVTFTGQGITASGIVAAPVLGSGPTPYSLATVDMTLSADFQFPEIISSGGIGASRFTETLATPNSANDHCLTGQFWDDTNYHYVCVAPNTIKRVALSGF